MHEGTSGPILKEPKFVIGQPVYDNLHPLPLIVVGLHQNTFGNFRYDLKDYTGAMRTVSEAFLKPFRPPHEFLSEFMQRHSPQANHLMKQPTWLEVTRQRLSPQGRFLQSVSRHQKESPVHPVDNSV